MGPKKGSSKKTSVKKPNAKKAIKRISTTKKQKEKDQKQKQQQKKNNKIKKTSTTTTRKTKITRKPSTTKFKQDNNGNILITKEVIEDFENGRLNNNAMEEIRKIDPKVLPHLHQQLLARFEDPSQVAVLSVKSNSLLTYTRFKDMVVTRTSYRTGKKFPYTAEGLRDFLTDPLAIEEVTGKSCSSIISAFFWFYELDHNQKISMQKRDGIFKALKSRNMVVPDSSRVSGAVTRERLHQFRKFIDKKNENEMKQETKQLFKDAATMCYCGALRISQCIGLKGSSFEKDKKKKDIMWVSMIRKSKKEGLHRENKILDPETLDLAMEIVARRSRGNDNLLFEEWTPSIQQKFGAILKEASIVLNWPAGQHFQGTHMMRHGAVQDAVKERGIQFAKLRSGHESDSCLEIYARTDVERQTLLKEEEEENSQKEKLVKKLLDDLDTMYEKKMTEKDMGNIKIAPMTYDFAEAAKERRDTNSKAYLKILQGRMTGQKWTDEPAPPNWSDTEEIERRFTFYTSWLRSKLQQEQIQFQQQQSDSISELKQLCQKSWIQTRKMLRIAKYKRSLKTRRKYRLHIQKRRREQKRIKEGQRQIPTVANTSSKIRIKKAKKQQQQKQTKERKQQHLEMPRRESAREKKQRELEISRFLSYRRTAFFLKGGRPENFDPQKELLNWKPKN